MPFLDIHCKLNLEVSELFNLVLIVVANALLSNKILARKFLAVSFNPLLALLLTANALIRFDKEIVSVLFNFKLILFDSDAVSVLFNLVLMALTKTVLSNKILLRRFLAVSINMLLALLFTALIRLDNEMVSVLFNLVLI